MSHCIHINMFVLLIGYVLIYGANGQVNVALTRANATCTASQTDCQRAIDGFSSFSSNVLIWGFRSVATGTWIKVTFNQQYTIYTARFMQMYYADESNFKDLTLSFSDGSSQQVTLSSPVDGYVWDTFNLTPVSTTSVEVLVVSSYASASTYNGFQELEFYDGVVTATTSTSIPTSTTTKTATRITTTTSTTPPTTTSTTTITPTTTTITTTPTSTTPTTTATTTTITPTTTTTTSTTTSTAKTTTPTKTTITTTPTPTPTHTTTTPTSTTPSSSVQTTGSKTTLKVSSHNSTNTTAIAMGIVIGLLVVAFVTVLVICKLRQQGKHFCMINENSPHQNTSNHDPVQYYNDIKQNDVSSNDGEAKYEEIDEVKYEDINDVAKKPGDHVYENQCTSGIALEAMHNYTKLSGPVPTRNPQYQTLNIV